MLTIEPPEKLVEEVLTVIDFKDAEVFAAAVHMRVNVILTLDRKHFIENPLIQREYPFLEALTPGDFIKKYFI